MKNYKRRIVFEYRREKVRLPLFPRWHKKVWRLKKLKVNADQEIRTFLKREDALPPRETRDPCAVLKKILDSLTQEKLDGGSVTEEIRPAYHRVEIRIRIKEEKPRGVKSPKDTPS